MLTKGKVFEIITRAIEPPAQKCCGCAFPCACAISAAAAEIAALHDGRVTELLAANNDYEKQARDGRTDAKQWERRFRDVSAAFFELVETISRRRRRAEEALQWGVDTFGLDSKLRRERATRFGEEALEVMHHEGVPPEMVDALRDRVYSRPPGQIHREIGQAGLTLEVLAYNAGYDLDAAIQIEFDRCLSSSPDEFRKSHAAKVAVGLSFTGAPPTDAA
jgi:hypothetical protein